MRKRIGISLDEKVIKQLQQLQSQLVYQTNTWMSFSDVVNMVLKEGWVEDYDN